jgi:two-component system copper resistance phosphate regulon response regulator CusR
MRILLVEDETNAARILAKRLCDQAYAVDTAGDGEEALRMALTNEYDVVILDVMLPRKDGLTVCRELRAAANSVPILMLTARDSVENRISGLDGGADDYLVKPFDFRELLARVRALLRRKPAMGPGVIQVEDLSVDIRSRTVSRGGMAIALTAKEFTLVEYLARHTGEVLSRREIADHVWDQNFDPFSNLIEVYMRRLRRKIDDNHDEKLLHTRRGMGYVLMSAGGLDVQLR